MPRLDDYLSPASRLAADPFASRPRRVTPEEQSTLDYLGETSLGGLAYLGKLADKTFGGRAIRGGVLGGNPRELLSVIPLSDTLGLTDERDIVYGKKLLEDAGIISRDPTPGFGWNDVAGIAADIALDPATYLGFGTLTKAGTLAAKAGAALPRTTAARIGGWAAREADLAAHGNPYQVAKAMGLDHTNLLDDATDQLLKQAGLNAETRFLPTSATTYAANPAGATPLAGALGVGLPFSERTAVLTGPVGEFLSRYNPIRVASAPLRAADRAIDSATGFSPARSLRAMFDPSVKGMTSAPGQELGRFADATERSLERAGMTELANHVQDLTKALGADPAKVQTGLRYALSFAEDATLDPALATAVGRQPVPFAPAAGTVLAPAETAKVEEVVNAMKASMEARRQANAALGIASPELDDVVSYFLRSQQVLPRQPGEGLFNYVTRMNRQYGATHQSQIRREEIFRGIPGGTDRINRWASDPAMSGLTRTLQPLDVQQQIAAHLATNPQLAMTPVALQRQASSLADWLGSLPSAHSQQGVPFFSIDSTGNFAKYMGRTGAAQSAAETTYEGIARYAEPIVPGSPNADSLVPVGKILEDVGLVGKDAAGQPIAPILAAQRLGVSPNDLSRLGLDRTLYNDLRRLNQAWQNPGDVVPVLAAWDAASQVFKSWLTQIWPAYTTRNVMQSIWAMWRGTGSGPMGAIDPTAMGAAFKFLRGHGFDMRLPGMVGRNAEELTRELTTELIGNGVALVPRGNNMADILGQAGEQMMRRPNLPVDSGKSLLGDATEFAKGYVPRSLSEASPLHIRGVLDAERSTNSVMRQAETLNRVTDDWGRISHYVALRRQGFAPAAAADEVAKLHLDYGRLSQFDKQVSRRLFPWFSFSRRSLPPLLEEAVTNPGKVAATLRGTTEGRTPFEYTPSYIAEAASIPVPGAPDGQQRYISSFGTNLEDDSTKLLGELLHGNMTRAGEMAIGASMPQIKMPLEAIFGKQLSTGRRLEDLKPYQSVAELGLPDDVARRLTQLAQATPGSRGLSTIDRILDTRKPWWQRAVNVGSGVRFSDVDVEKSKPYAEKRLLEDLLAGRPGFKRSEAVYRTKAAKESGAVSPADAAIYDLLQRLDSNLRRQGR